MQNIWRGQGACPFITRLEQGRLVWPLARKGKVALTPAQLSVLLGGDWRACSAVDGGDDAGMAAPTSDDVAQEYPAGVECRGV